MHRIHRTAVHGKKPLTIRLFVSVHEGQEILSASRRNNTNDYLWTKLDKSMLLVSVCLIFALARVEKKKNKAQWPLYDAKEEPYWATEYMGLVPRCEIKDNVTTTESKAWHFLPWWKWQIATKSKGM